MTEEIKKIFTEGDIKELDSMGINLDSDLLDPKMNSVFHAMLTTDSEESRMALRGLLGAAIGRCVTSATVKTDVLPVTGLQEKQAAFDVHVTFNDGDEADIEMQMRIRDNLFNRCEFNTARLYCSQGIRGKRYADLNKVYTIMILNSTLFPDSDSFIDEFMYRNAKGKVFSGNTQIIIVELTKLVKVSQKPVPDMSAIEKWALYLKYCNHKGKQKLIRELKESMEDIKMGAQVLETISSDRVEFLNHFYKLKAEIDRDSQLLHAKEEGLKEGLKEGADERVELKGIIAEKDNELAEKDKEIAELLEKLENK